MRKELKGQRMVKSRDGVCSRYRCLSGQEGQPAERLSGGVSRARIASLVQRSWDLRSKIGMHHLCHCFGMESSEEH